MPPDRFPIPQGTLDMLVLERDSWGRLTAAVRLIFAQGE